MTIRDPRVVDLVRRDQREQRPDIGVGLPADVLARARPEGVVERVLVGVDEEVDRLSLGDPEQLRGLARRPSSPIARASAPKASSPSYQCTRTRSPAAVCQSNRSSA